jgi:hypothetical protein
VCVCGHGELVRLAQCVVTLLVLSSYYTLVNSNESVHSCEGIHAGSGIYALSRPLLQSPPPVLVLGSD